jgi:ribose 5-phosphate isomerase B
MKIAIGSDHGGFELKEFVKSFLINKEYEIVDFGTNSEESVDYPDIAKNLCKDLLKGKFDRGILICGTGIGMSITANRFKGVRATLANDLFSAIMSRKHNDSNVLVMGGRVIGKEVAKEIVKAWLTEKYEGGRHQRRLDKIDRVEF